MSMYIPQIKEEISENAKMLIIEDDGKVYRAEIPKKQYSLLGVKIIKNFM